MKKLKWIGSETEFLEFMMFIDTVLYEICVEQRKLNYPAIIESAKLLERFIDVDYEKFDSFFTLKMRGKPIGVFFHGLLRIKKVIQKNIVNPTT